MEAENGLVNAEIRDTIRVMKNNIPPNQPLDYFHIKELCSDPIVLSSWVLTF